MAKTLLQRMKDEGILEQVEDIDNYIFSFVLIFTLLCSMLLGFVLFELWKISLFLYSGMLVVGFSTLVYLTKIMREDPDLIWKFKRRF